jgi:hypothetical protein
MRIEKIERKVLKQAKLFVGLLSIIMFLGGNWGAMANSPVNSHDPEPFIQMIVKVNDEKVLKNFKVHMAEDEDTVGFTTGREGFWRLVKGHKSSREATPTEAEVSQVEINLTGKWEIQEEDRTYQATLDAKGNGPYTWQEGRLQTERVVGRLWSGTWHQKGNDREGGFEVLLSEDGKTADGAWWYLRVGTHNNIPPRLEGGTYKMKRLSP